MDYIIDEIVRLGFKCNFSCPYCNITKDNEKDLSEANFEQAKKRVDFAVMDKDVAISISGGEPTLYPYLLDLIKYAKSRHAKINLQTNASLVTKNLARELRLSGLDSAFVNFVSHKPQVFSELTGVPELNFQKTIQGIRHLLSENISVILNIVITELNYKFLPEYVEFVSEHFPEIAAINFSVIQPHGNARKNRFLVPDYRDIRPYIKQAIEIAEKKEVKIINPYCGMPLCMTFDILSPDENSEFHAAVEVRKTGRTPDPLKRVDSSKIRTSSCRDCYIRSFCLGVWTAYYEIKGDVVEPPVRSIRFWPVG